MLSLLTQADGSIDGCYFTLLPVTALTRQNAGSWSEQIDYSSLVPANEQRTLWIRDAIVHPWGASKTQFGAWSLTVKMPGDDSTLPWRVLISGLDGDPFPRHRPLTAPGIPLTKDDKLCLQASWRSYALDMDITPMFGTNPTCKLQFSVQIVYRITG